jgi:hypothetical protein
LTFLGLLLPFIVIAFDYLNNAPATSIALDNATAGNLYGGVLYQLLLWSVWPIYNFWTPRNGFTYYPYLYTIPSLVAPFVFYYLILLELVKKQRSIFLTAGLISLLAFIFFAKGPQAPLGEIYTYLVNHFPPFVLFRSPDNKFGFGVIFSIAFLLLLIASEYKKKFFIGCLILVILIQGSPIFTGQAIRGENKKNISWDKIIHMPKSYIEVATFLNNNAIPFGYIMPIPYESYSKFSIYEKKLFIGPDLLPKLTKLPFLYLSEHAAIATNTYGELSSENIEGLKRFPIKYFILRNDVYKKSVSKNLQEDIAKSFNKVYTNNTFTVYENKKVLPLINSSNISYQVISPVMYRVSFKKIKKEQVLALYLTYDKNWKLFPEKILAVEKCKKEGRYTAYSVTHCKSEETFFNKRELEYIKEKPLFDTSHKQTYGYANSWKINPKTIKDSLDKSYYREYKDGSLDITFTIYFIRQAYLYYSFIFSGIVFTIYMSIILFKKVKK